MELLKFMDFLLHETFLFYVFYIPCFILNALPKLDFIGQPVAATQGMLLEMAILINLSKLNGDLIHFIKREEENIFVRLKAPI